MDKRDKFINDNMGLVYACVKRFKNKGIDYEDLLQAGTLGLIKAYDKFDESLGYKFSTYAIPVILGEIKHIFRENSLVKVSRTLKELSLKITRESEKFCIANGRSPTISELSALLGVDREKIIQALDSAKPTLSFSAFCSTNGDDGKEIDVPSDENFDNIFDKIALRQAIDDLTKEEKKIIILRFFKDKTQSETASELGTTQVQISRKEKKILATLKSKLA